MTKEQLINRIKSRIEKFVKSFPRGQGYVELDSCTYYDDPSFILNNEKGAVIKVNKDGVVWINDLRSKNPEEIQIVWVDMTQFSENALKNIYNNLVGTIHNDAW
jgi:hypothetical protein